jgi:hypothetical protein
MGLSVLSQKLRARARAKKPNLFDVTVLFWARKL